MAAITPNQAIRNAIEAELAAARFYRLLAESTEDAEGKRFLEEMSVNEEQHAKAIELEGEKIATGPLARKADGEVDMIETLPEWKYADGITLGQALDVAYEAELQAAMYYDAFADHFHGHVQEFFRKLGATEEEHAKSIDQRRAKARR